MYGTCILYSLVPFYLDITEVLVNLNNTFQSIIGFGGAFTDAAGIDLNLKLYENPNNISVQSNSTAKTRPQTCDDVDVRCPQWAQWCGIDEYVDNNCRKLCKNCR